MLYRDQSIPLLEPAAETAGWTPQAVLSALVQAYSVLSATTGKVGPRGMKAYWPEYNAEFADLAAQAEIERPDRFRRRRRFSSIEIQRMEMALLGWTSAGVHHPAWLNGNLLAYERPRLCVVAYIIAKGKGMSEVDLCRQLGWALATFKRHKMAAATMVSHRLNRANIAAW